MHHDRWGYTEGIIDGTIEGPAFGWACTSQLLGFELSMMDGRG